MSPKYYKGQHLWLPEQVVIVAIALPQPWWYTQIPRYKIKKPHLAWKTSYWLYEFLLDRMIDNQIQYLKQVAPPRTLNGTVKHITVDWKVEF